MCSNSCFLESTLFFCFFAISIILIDVEMVSSFWEEASSQVASRFSVAPQAASRFSGQVIAAGSFALLGHLLMNLPLFFFLSFLSSCRLVVFFLQSCKFGDWIFWTFSKKTFYLPSKLRMLGFLSILIVSLLAMFGVWQKLTFPETEISFFFVFQSLSFQLMLYAI